MYNNISKNLKNNTRATYAKVLPGSGIGLPGNLSGTGWDGINIMQIRNQKKL